MVSTVFRFVGIFALLATNLVVHGQQSDVDMLNKKTEFNNWLVRFIRNRPDTAMYSHMFANWLDNDQYIWKTNAKNATYVLGHNAFSGMNTSEYRRYIADSYVRPMSRQYIPGYTVVESQLPTSVDWVANGGVTPVKDQGQCGSCWSFSTTGAMEGAHFIKTGELVSFSEQQLVDCDFVRNGGKEMGCKGGQMDSAFQWIADNGGICSEPSYPYVSGDTQTTGKCQKCQTVANSGVKSFIDVEPNSDAAMMTILAERPVSIAIEADQRDFQLYTSGVFTGECGASLDHGVLAVGYGTMSGVDYYKVKNSWSATWGNNGYILLGRGTDPATKKPYNGGKGQCGILMEASYPVL